ncbi:MAG: hypothetical protein ACI8P0_001295 [Planctomycetaceae bacterium]|jgi:hypothetical protein
MSIKQWRQDFHDDAGTNLLLTCDDGSCLVEFATSSSRPAMRVELLIQPWDRRGLPDGPPVELHAQCASAETARWTRHAGPLLAATGAVCGICPELFHSSEARVILFRDDMRLMLGADRANADRTAETHQWMPHRSNIFAACVNCSGRAVVNRISTG